MFAKILVGVISLMSFCSFTITSAYAQVRVGVAYSPYLNFSQFDNSLINKTITKNPTLLYSADVLLKEPLGRQIDIEAGFGFSRIGYQLKEFGEDYIGGRRYETVAVMLQSTRFFRIPLSVNLKFPNRNFYVQLGSNIQLTSNRSGIQSVTTFGGTTFGNHIFKGVQEPRDAISASLFMGVGIEKQLFPKHFLNVGLIYNQGFVPVVAWKINYTIDQTDYANEITNRGSYIGLRLVYYIYL